MKYCEYCGSEAQNHYSNCRSCGAPFSIKTVYSKDDATGPSTGLSPDLAFDLLPLMVSMAIISYAFDKVGNLFRFKRKRVPDIQPARYVYEKRRGYL